MTNGDDIPTESRLLLMRHAHTHERTAFQEDHDRQLTNRGMSEANSIAHWIVDQGFCPQLILVSSAVRAQQTKECLLEVFSETAFVPEHVFAAPDLYLAPPETICQRIASDGCGGRSILVIGHNPGMGTLVGQLMQQNIGFPTATCAVFSSNAANPWQRINPDGMHLLTVGRPSDP